MSEKETLWRKYASELPCCKGSELDAKLAVLSRDIRHDIDTLVEFMGEVDMRKHRASEG